MKSEKQKLKVPLFSCPGTNDAEFTHYSDAGKWVILYGKSGKTLIKSQITREKAAYLGVIAS